MNQNSLMARTASHCGATLAFAMMNGCYAGNPEMHPSSNKTAEVVMANERQAQADEQAQDALCTMMGFMETTLALAAPRLMAKSKRIPSREELLKVLDEHNRIFSAAKANPNTEEGKEQIRVAPLAIELRELVSNWTPSKDVPPEIVARARAILAAMNAAEPPEGWDNYEGAPQ